MAIALVQVLLTALACFGMWRWWRVLDGRGVASRVIAVGFLIRAFGGVVLFWISWLALPIARSMQLGRGFWFFAIDGQWYVGYTRELLSHGVGTIFSLHAAYPSHIFTQSLTVAAAAFGSFASTAILFNCAAYLATSAVILRIGSPQAERARLFALSAVAFGPATILWSMQPLKDSFFVLLITAIVATCAAWQALWRDAAVRSQGAILLCAAAMGVLTYAIAGTRWYVGGLIAGISLLFVLLVANIPRPRFAASIVAALLFVGLSQAFVLGGDFDIPDVVRKTIDPRELFRPRAENARMTLLLTTARRGFELTPGGTAIKPGGALIASATPAIAPKPAPQKAAAETLPVAIARKEPILAAELKPATPPAKVTPTTAPPTTTVAPIVMPAPIAVATSAPPVARKEVVASPPAQSVATVPPPVRTQPPPSVTTTVATTATAATTTAVTATVPAPTPVVPVVESTSTTFAAEPPATVATKHPKRRHTPVKPSPLPVKVAPPVVTTAPPPAPAKPPVVVPEPSPRLSVKMILGAAAMFLPRSIAQPLGLVRIGGGRGLWLFADVDTVVFDFVIVFAFAFCARQLVRRQGRITPLFILVALLFAALTAPMIYSVTNFGTLFRLRQMLYVFAALLPLTLDLREPAR